jgi:hypothetical protein
MAIALTVGLSLPAGAGAATAAQAVANLNAQRSANGIPAGITENASASADCAAHNNYERENGGILTHTETMGAPGYTTGGAEAGQTSVLAADTNWNTTNPWESAPIHLSQLLDPYLQSMGVNDANGFVCATTLPPEAGFRIGPATPTAYTYPGNGQKNWPTSEKAYEAPFTPGDLLGLPQPRVTGPYLFLLFAGPWGGFSASVTISSATLKGPSGTVPIKVADGTTPTQSGDPPLSAYIGSTAMLIPDSPLAAGATYTAQATGTASTGGGGPSWPVSSRFSFTTAVSAASLRAQSHVGLGKATRKHKTLRFKLTASGAYVGVRAKVQVKVSGKVVHRSTVKLSASRTITAKNHKHTQVVVTVPAFTVDGVKFAARRLTGKG